MRGDSSGEAVVYYMQSRGGVCRVMTDAEYEVNQKSR